MALAIVPAPSSDDVDAMWRYELRPPYVLPVLDLSLSLKARFLSPAAARVVDYITSYRRTLGATGLVANMFVLAMLLVPANVGEILAPIGFTLWVPIVVAGTSSLRYDVVRLLLHTYDFWFSSCVNLCVAAALGLLFRDTRSLLALGLWSGVQLNVMIDATIRRIRSTQLFNIVALVLYSIVWVIISLSLVDGLEDFPLVHYRTHELSAVAFATNGLVTVIALIGRNIYRRRSLLDPTARLETIECASYRTNLQIYAFATSGPQQQEPARRGPVMPRPDHVKALQYVQSIGCIDARETLLRRSVCEWLARRGRCSPRAVAWLGRVPLCVFASSAFFNLEAFHSRSHFEASAHYTGFVLTLVYCGLCATLYQRTLLRALVTSFDFAFLLLQITVIHVCACQFYDWVFDNALAVATSWIWSLWFLCLDALPPVRKRQLCITKCYTVAVALLLTTSSLVLLYLVVCTDVAVSEPYRRVMWHARVFDHHELELKWSSVFFNSFATMCALNWRLVWRTVTLETDVLLLLDGVVVYENYLQQTHQRVRAWSVAAARASLQSLRSKS